MQKTALNRFAKASELIVCGYAKYSFIKMKGDYVLS